MYHKHDIVKKMSNKWDDPLALGHRAIVGFRPGKVVGPLGVSSVLPWRLEDVSFRSLLPAILLHFFAV